MADLKKMLEFKFIQEVDSKFAGLISLGDSQILRQGKEQQMDEELNRGLSFLGLTKEQRDSFSPRPVPVLFRLEAGDCVYKWTSYSLVNPKNRRITEYWCPWKSLKIGSTEIPGFKELRMRYRNVGGSVGRPQEFARSRNAVTEQWNGMESLMKAELKKPVWGFVGKTSSQRKFNDADHPAEQFNVLFIGGDFQLCIPNLTPDLIKQL